MKSIISNSEIIIYWDIYFRYEKDWDDLLETALFKMEIWSTIHELDLVCIENEWHVYKEVKIKDENKLEDILSFNNINLSKYFILEWINFIIK
jgi:hypothetical protein